MRKHEYEVRFKKYPKSRYTSSRAEPEMKPEMKPDSYKNGLPNTGTAAGTAEPDYITSQQHKNRLSHSGNPKDGKNKEFTKILTSLPKALLADFNEFMKIRGYSTYSEIIRGSVRKYISDYEQMDYIKGYHAGAATIVYDHTKRGFLDALEDIQRNYSHLIRFSMHILFNREDCLEVIILDGDSEEIKKLAEAMKTLKGVKFSELKTVSLVDKT